MKCVDTVHGHIVKWNQLRDNVALADRDPVGRYAVLLKDGIVLRHWLDVKIRVKYAIHLVYAGRFPDRPQHMTVARLNVRAFGTAAPLPWDKVHDAGLKNWIHVRHNGISNFAYDAWMLLLLLRWRDNELCGIATLDSIPFFFPMDIIADDGTVNA